MSDDAIFDALRNERVRQMLNNPRMLQDVSHILQTDAQYESYLQKITDDELRSQFVAAVAPYRK